jgi:hypothetical protein
MKFALLASPEDRSRSSFFFAGRLRSSRLLLAVLLLGAAPARPPSAQTQPAPAACSAPAFHVFDFWVGSWDVYDAADRQFTARARVTSVQDGCALREEFRSLDGAGGESLSSWDASQHQWRQHWVSSRGAVVSLAGNLRSASMILTGPETGTHSPDLVRGTWTSKPDGVRELGERSTDGGHTWQPWFDLQFRRAGTGPPR